jgi:hypothetical protein
MKVFLLLSRSHRLKLSTLPLKKQSKKNKEIHKQNLNKNRRPTIAKLNLVKTYQTIKRITKRTSQLVLQ